MNGILMLLGIGVAGIAGYLVEPSLRERLTGETPRPTSNVTIVNIDELEPEQLPEKISISVPVELSSPDGSVTLPAGSLVKPLAVEGHSLRVGMNHLKGKVAIEDTDLLKQLTANPPRPIVKSTDISPPVAVVPAPIPVPVPTPVPVPVPTPVLTPEPEQELVTRGESEPETTIPEPTAAAEVPSTGDQNDIVKIMQNSYRSGMIKEFVIDKAVAWKATGEETVDGMTYQTGLVDYSAETIFGVKNVQAKALIRAGKVVKWISPKSGMEIK
jgi:hypothetical protein